MECYYETQERKCTYILCKLYMLLRSFFLKEEEHLLIHVVIGGPSVGTDRDIGDYQKIIHSDL